MRKRLSGFFLFLVLIFQILPVLSFAEESEEVPEEKPMVFSQIQDGDFLYFGEYKREIIKWKVLDADAMSTGEPGLFLLSAYMVRNDGISFGSFGEEEEPVWKGSDAQKWCKSFYTAGFSARELPAVAATTKKDEGGVFYTLRWKASALDKEFAFFLSAEEAAHYIGPNNGDPGLSATASDGSVGYWWLRSAQGKKAGLVVSENKVTSDKPFKPWGARPAVNLSFQNLVFASSANDKSELGEIQIIDETSDGEWKLTITDPTRLFEVKETHLKDGILSVSYTGAAVGENEYISILVNDAEGKPYAYGRLLKPERAAGEFSVSLSDYEFPEGASLYLFSEQDNGVGKTDYAGTLQQVMVTIAFDPGEGSGEMESLTIPLGSVAELPEPDFQAPYGMVLDWWAAEEGLFDAEMHVLQDGTVFARYAPAVAKEIALDKVAAVLPLFESITIHATVLPEDAIDTSVKWVGGDDIAKLTDHGDGNCTIEALSPGNTNVTAISGDGRVTLDVPVTVTGTSSMAKLSDYWIYIAGGFIALVMILVLIRRIVRRVRIRRMMRSYDE